MELREFIPVLECVIKCADNHIVYAEIPPFSPEEIRVYFDEDYYIAVDAKGMSLMEVIFYVGRAILEHKG